MKKSYEMDMCNGPLLGKILVFTFPLMLSGVLQLLFNAADIVVVGRFSGAHALAAVGSTSSLVNLLVNALMGSLWNLMLRGGVYWGWFLPSLGKNLVTVLPKTLVIYVLFQALLPILQQMGVIPRQLDEKGRLPLI